ncbi:hypothetical protein GQ457_04G013570 [Hibiscus cannabinus]
MVLHKTGYRYSREVVQVNSRVSEAGALNESLNGVSGGRPPDSDRSVVVPSRLERLANPVTEEDQQVVKRSRGESDKVMDIGVEEIIAAPTNGLQEGVVNDETGEKGEIQHGGAPYAKPSFRDMLLGQSIGAAAASTISDLDVEVQEGDVHISDMDGTPVIRFSDRIHDLVDAKLENSVIVRLLGRAIGYNALLNRIRSLWNPSGEVGLVDLDNNYCLVRFANAADVSKVLVGGPWVIYGNYLTVQPWSRNFSTDLDHPEKIVVWARLPGLPYRYYPKSMLRYIASVIGRVVKIDYNTSEGKRGRFARLAAVVDLNKPLVPGILIDGIYQRIEYEGLPTICYSCGRYGHTDDGCKKFMEDERSKQRVDTNVVQFAPPKEKFGPWMQVSSRRSRKGSKSKVVHAHATPKTGNFKATGSSFAVLADVTDDHTSRVEDMDRIADAASDGLVAEPMIITEGGGLGNNVVEHDGVHENRLVAIEMDGSEKRVLLRGLRSEDSSKKLLNVRVVERGANLGSKTGAGRRSIFGLKDGVTKGSLKLGISKKGDRGGGPARTKQSSRQSGKIGLEDWVGSLDRELEESVKGSRQHSLGSNKQVAETVDVQWRENDSFVSLKQLGSDHRPILLVTDSLGAVKRSPSFKYLAAWQSHGGFEEMLAGSWKSDLSIVKNIANFQTAACRWNHESFGHIVRRKHSILARI